MCLLCLGVWRVCSARTHKHTHTHTHPAVCTGLCVNVSFFRHRLDITHTHTLGIQVAGATAHAQVVLAVTARRRSTGPTVSEGLKLLAYEAFSYYCMRP
jgi:hypothetical protein